MEFFYDQPSGAMVALRRKKAPAITVDDNSDDKDGGIAGDVAGSSDVSLCCALPEPVAGLGLLPAVVVPAITPAEYRELARKDLQPILNKLQARIWTSRYTVTRNYVRPIVEAAESTKKNLIILSGTHGNARGMRTERSARLVHYEADVKAFVEKNKCRSSCVSVENITWLSDAEVGDILNGKNDVVVSFCYSRNDAQVLRHLGWLATTSYLNPERARSRSTAAEL